MRFRQVLGILVTTVVGIVIFFALVLVLSRIYPNSFIHDYQVYFNALIIAIGGILLTNLIAALISTRTKELVGESTAGALSFIIKMAGYIIVAISFFVFIKVDIAGALVAGGFAGLVVGLASQDVLGNIFGGIALVTTRPFKIGDRITVSTWQYGLIAPSYPPKFFSSDFLIPGYTGLVTEISLMYTSFLSDDNIPLKIPNSVLIQSSVFIHSRNETRVIRAKIEVPKDNDPDLLMPRIKEGLVSLPFIKGEVEVRIYETTLTTYIIVIQAMCKGQFEEPLRSEILRTTMKIIKNFRDEKK